MLYASSRLIGQLFLIVVVISWLGGCDDGIDTVYPAPILPRGGFVSSNPIPPPQRIFLENNRVKVGIDLNAGGAITYLRDGISGENMINNIDLGRQLQTSLYSGPIPFEPNGKKPVAVWDGLGWNPVQTGDIFNRPSEIVTYKLESPNQVYVKTNPLIWALRNEPAECQMEHWVSLNDNIIHVRSRTVIRRVDTTQYQARIQESPCMYLNGPYNRFISYMDNKPFTNDGLYEFDKPHSITDRYTTENWAALINKEGRGVGIYRANEFRFISGFFGSSNTGGEYDDNTAYLTAVPFHVLDHNIVHEFEYDLIVGSISDIRQFAYQQPRPSTKPDYTFVANRHGWHYDNTRDLGWPIGNELILKWGRIDVNRKSFAIKSPKVFWRASDVPRIFIEAAFTTTAKSARLNWRIPGDVEFAQLQNVGKDFPIIGDGKLRVYTLDMSQEPKWTGIISQIELEPTPESISTMNEQTGQLRLKRVSHNN